MTWNKKNQQFALSCDIRRSSIELLQWILRKTDDYKTTEKLIDLKDFNKWIGKYRPKGKYDPKTVKEAIAQLNDSTFGWVVIVKTHNWHLHQILVRPVQFAIQEKSQTSENVPKPKPRNAMYSDVHKKRLALLLQQNISKLDSLLSNIGLTYNQSSLRRIWAIVGQKLEPIERAVEMMLYQNSVKPDSIANPKAWLIACLKDGWHHTFDLHYSPDLPKFDSVGGIARYVREVFQGDKLCPE